MAYLTDDNNTTPIFSSYNNVDKNYQNDLEAKTPYEIEIEKSKTTNQFSSNKKTLESIPQVPEFAMQDYEDATKLPDWYTQLNVATPEEIEQWKKKGKIGWIETWQKQNKWDIIPFYGSTKEAVTMTKNATTLYKLRKGEDVSQEDIDTLTDFLRDMKELEVRGGRTVAGEALNGLMTSIPYMIEFGAASAIAGSVAGSPVGFGVMGQKLSQAGAKKAAQKAIQAEIKKLATESVMTGTKKNITGATTKAIYNKAMKQGLYRNLTELTGKEIAQTAMKSLPRTVGTSMLTGPVLMPQHFVRSVSDKQVSTGVYVTDAGQAVVQEPENIALSIFKAFGDTTFEALTETAGEMFAPTIKYFAKPIRNKLSKEFISSFDNLVEKAYGMPSSQALAKFGYHGVIEEMGEELLNRFLCQTFGINGLEEYNFEGFMNNVLYADKPTMWLSEAMSFAMAGGLGHTVANSSFALQKQYEKQKYSEKNLIKQYQKQQANTKENALTRLKEVQKIKTPYSSEEFYLDQGLIRIKGSQSLAEQLLREKLEQNNVDKATADEYLEHASELEIRDMLKTYQISQRDMLDLNNAKKATEAHNQLVEQMVQAGMKENEARSSAQIMVQAMLSATDKPIDEVMEMMHLNIQNMTVQEASNLVKGGITKNVYNKPQQNKNSLSPEDVQKANEIFGEVKQLLTSGNMITPQQMYQYADNGNTFVTYALEEKSKLDQDLQKELVEIDNKYTELFAKATSENEKDKIAEEQNAVLDAIQEKYNNSVNELIESFDETVKAFQLKNSTNTADIPEIAFQSASTAGAEDNIEDAQKEWEEKGTDSKYFQNWFGDSKIKNKDGKPIKVFHGSLWKFDTFEKGAEYNFSFSPVFANDYASQKSFEQALDLSPILYEAYLKVENPFDFRDEKQVDKILDMIGDNEIVSFGRTLNREEFKDDIMGFVYVNTVKRQDDFDKAEIGMAYSDINEDVEEHLSSVARNKIVLKNKDYFIAAQELQEPSFNYLDRDDRYYIRDKKSVYEQLEKIVKNIDFGNEYKKTITIKTEQAKKETAWGENGYYIKEDVKPYDLEVTLIKIDNPKLAKKEGGYDNWFSMESTLIGDKYFVEFLQENGFDGYYKQEKEQLNIAVFKPEQIKSVNNQGTFDSSNPNIYYQGNVESEFGQSQEELEEMFKQDVQNILAENNISQEEFSFEDLKLYGSYTTGKNKDTSDLDVLVQYSGNMREDDAFNMLNENRLTITDKNGVERTVDINPINRDKTGTIDDYIGKNKKNDIYQRTDKTKYLTDNEVEQLKKETKNFEIYVNKLIKNELSPLTQLKVLNQLTSAYNNIPALKGKKVVITQEIYKKIIDLPNKYKKNHFVDRTKAIKLPALIADPLYILQSHSEGYEHRFVIVTNAKNPKTNERLSIIFEPKSDVIIVSGYNEEIDISKEKKAKRVLYDKKKELSKTLAASKTVTIDNSNNIITNNQQNFNPNVYYQSNYGQENLSYTNIMFQSAYNGSPANFDRFSTEYIGTGEGHQAHGWGLYFAKNKEVSEEYRETLAGNYITYNGKEINPRETFYFKKIKFDKQDLINYCKEKIKYAEEDLKRYNNEKKHNEIFNIFYDEYRILQNELKEAKEMLERTESIEPDKIEIKKSGQLFEVDIPEDDVLLDEQELLDEQPKKVQDAIQNLYNDYEWLQNELESSIEYNATGKELYNALAQEFGKKEASLLLNQYGIKGIKYDGRQDGECYVIFDDKAISIINKYYQSEWDYEDKYQVLENARISVDELQLNYEYKIVSDIIDSSVRIGTFSRIKETKDNPVHKEVLVFKDKKGNAFEVSKDSFVFDAKDDVKGLLTQFYNDLGVDNLKDRDAKYGVIAELENIKIEQELSENNDEPLNDKRGFSYQTKNFDGSIKDNLIVLIQNHADQSTIMHEFAHVYLETINQLAKVDARARENLIAINKYLRFNGVSYTEAQHEKFARGFEAYLMSGKAPNYNIKKAFENFRTWLRNIYLKMKSGTFAEDLVLDEETEELFNNLLGGKSYKLYDDAASEIIQKAERNALLKVNEKNSKTKAFNPTRLTDKQIRYRDCAIEILSVASGYSFKYVQMSINDSRRMDNIFAKCEASDRISSTDGFMPHWAEFFGDTGVSYENQELGGDYELAYDAYQVLVNRTYLEDIDNPHRKLDEEFEDYLECFKYEFDYILNEYKENPDKEIAMLAFYDWADKLHPYVIEDYIDKWQRETEKIDRRNNLNKFEKAKEDLLLVAASMKHQGDFSQQFAEYSRHILKSLDFLAESDKRKIFDKLKDYNSFSEMQKDLDNIMDYAKTLDEVSNRKMMADEIISEVKSTIHEWKNGIKKTKYTYPANKLFSRLREINRMRMVDVQDMYDEMLQQDLTFGYRGDEIHDSDYFEQIEKMFVQFKANGFYYNSTEFLTSLLDKIKYCKYTSKIARDEMDYERRMQQVNLVDEIAAALDKHKGKISAIEKGFGWAMNLNNALEMMFSKEIKEKFSLDYLYAMKDAKVGADRDEVLRKIAQVFGFDGKFANTQLFNKFIDMTKPEFEITQRYTPDKVLGQYRETSRDEETGKEITERVINLRGDEQAFEQWHEEVVTLSRMQVLYFYIQAKNPTTYDILTNMGDETTPPKGQFNKFDFDELLDQLTEQEKLMGDILQLAAEKYYDQLNEYHIDKYQVELGKVKGYFPRKTEAVQEKIYEPFSDYTSQKSVQKFQKQRTAGAGTRISPANALEVLFTHIEQANTLIIMGRQLDLMNRVFNDVDLKKKIGTIWGEDIKKDFYNMISANLFTGQSSALSQAEQTYRNIFNNVVKSQIFAKPQVGLKQLISFMNYGVGDEYVSALEWWSEFAKQSLTPQNWSENIKFMMSIPYLKDRFGRGGSTDAMKEQLETRMFAKINLLDDYLSMPIRYGDIGAIILGGKPYIDILLRKGYTQEEAIKIFIEKTVNDQQSSIPSTLSNMQRNAAKHPFTKMFFAYQNTPWQYFRTSYMAVVRFMQNPNYETGMNAAKLVALYCYVFPLIFNVASSLSIIALAGGGGDDDLMNDLWKSAIGGFTFIPIFGSFINSIWTGFNGDGIFGGDWFASAYQKANSMARHVHKGEITPMDIFTAISLFGEAGTGLPINSLGTEISGFYDMAQGKFGKGLIKALGFTDYRARKITGEEE